MMMPHSHNLQNNIIKGEASESDSEDEQYAIDAVKNTDPKRKQMPHGTVVDGEAPESDDDIGNFQIPVNYETNSSVPQHNNHFEKTDSLLIKKLGDCNFSLWNHLNTMIQGTALSASKQILSTDQMLLKSQVTLQTTSSSIKKINDNTTQILEKYKYAITENFIPNIKI